MLLLTKSGVSVGCSIVICPIMPNSYGKEVLEKRKFDVIRRLLSISSNPVGTVGLAAMPAGRNSIEVC